MEVLTGACTSEDTQSCIQRRSSETPQALLVWKKSITFLPAVIFSCAKFSIQLSFNSGYSQDLHYFAPGFL